MHTLGAPIHFGPEQSHTAYQQSNNDRSLALFCDYIQSSGDRAGGLERSRLHSSVGARGLVLDAGPKVPVGPCAVAEVNTQALLQLRVGEVLDWPAGGRGGSLCRLGSRGSTARGRCRVRGTDAYAAGKGDRRFGVKRPGAESRPGGVRHRLCGEREHIPSWYGLVRLGAAVYSVRSSLKPRCQTLDGGLLLLRLLLGLLNPLSTTSPQ